MWGVRSGVGGGEREGDRGSQGCLSLIKHLLCVCWASCKYCLPVTSSPTGILGVSAFSGRRHWGFMHSGLPMVLRDVKKSNRGGIQIQFIWQQNLCPSHHFPTHPFLQVHGVLVLFWNQENPHNKD